jgi:hypothetical protein
VYFWSFTNCDRIFIGFLFHLVKRILGFLEETYTKRRLLSSLGHCIPVGHSHFSSLRPQSLAPITKTQSLVNSRLAIPNNISNFIFMPDSETSVIAQVKAAATHVDFD